MWWFPPRGMSACAAFGSWYSDRPPQLGMTNCCVTSEGARSGARESQLRCHARTTRPRPFWKGISLRWTRLPAGRMLDGAAGACPRPQPRRGPRKLSRPPLSRSTGSGSGTGLRGLGALELIGSLSGQFPGTTTASMTWMTPLDASMSVAVTRAEPFNRTSPL